MQDVISIVTPSYNQAEYIGATIKSILSQKGDFFIDYVIIDGASTDNSRSIIEDFEVDLKSNCAIEKHYGYDFYVARGKYSFNQCKGISYRWLSEIDDGHAHALNKGFELTFGNIMCWLNSDDMYHKDAFQALFEIFSQLPQVKWITGLNTIWNKDGTQRQLTFLGKHNYKNVYSFLTNDYEWIQQETTFWKRELWDVSGGRINTQYKLMVDGELWCRFFLYEDIYHVNRELGGYRKHDTNRANTHMNKVKSELDQAVQVLEKNVSPEIREIAHCIADNSPLENLNFSQTNFKIIDRDNGNNYWEIKEVDFFKYSLKRSAARIRAFQDTNNFINNSDNASLNLLENKLREKDVMIAKILNSKRYKLGNILLTPLATLLTLPKKLRVVFMSIMSIIRLVLTRKAWKLLIQVVQLDWRTITKFDHYLYVNSNNQLKWTKTALKRLLTDSPDIPNVVNTQFLFIKTLIRPDYNTFFNEVYEKCQVEKIKTDITYKTNPKFFYRNALKLIWYIPVFFKIYQHGLKSTFYRYLKAISYLSVLNVAYNYKFKTLVTFADMQSIENMLVQYFRKQGKTTITLQHGLYVDYTTFENINKVNYESVVSDYFLAWGNETKALIGKYHPDVKVTICGKPIDLTPPAQKEDYFTLVFDQNIFKKQNTELLTIASEIAVSTGLKINIRLHPWNNRSAYNFNAEISVFDRTIESSQFVIGHTTSMIFECMRSGIPAYKYRTDVPANVIDDRLKFSDAEELLQCLENTKDFDFVEAGKYYLQYLGEESLEQYRLFFNQLIDDSRNNPLKN